MVALLGSGDELLHVIERDFPGTDIHVRGNEITVTGPADDTALVDRLFGELTTMVARGTELSAALVEQTVGRIARQPYGHLIGTKSKGRWWAWNHF